MAPKLLKYLLFFTLFLSLHCFSYNKLPILFEENNGQLPEFSGSTNKILFQANLPNLSIWVTEKGLIYNFYKVKNALNSNALILERASSQQQIDWFRSEMLLKGAVISSGNLIKKGKADFENRYIKEKNANQIQTNSFEELYFTNVYEGIDWRIFIENNQVKQEFVVQSHANSKLINLEYISTGNIDVKEQEIKISNKLGVFTEGKLVCYQANKNVKAKYNYTKSFSGNGQDRISHYFVGITTEKYNENEKLIIDPILQWSTFFGGGSDEDAHSIYSDGSNTWVAGHSQSFNFPTLNPGSSAYYQGSNAGGFGDAFILKFSSTGALIWGTYFGGTQNEEVLSIFSSGTNVWVAGYTNSTDFPVLNPGGGAFYQGTMAGVSDAFILKFNTSGVLNWSTFVGGVNAEYFSALQFKNNELYVAGVSSSTNFPVVNAGTFFQNYSALNDGVILKFNASNSLVWSTYIGGSGNDNINTIQANATDIFIGGYTNSPNFNVINSGGYFQSTLTGSYDAFVSKFALNGTLSWSTFFGGENLDKINSLTLDNNNVWITGTTSSTTLPVFNAGGTSYFQGTNSGFSDGFIAKFNLANTSLKWSSYYGGSSNDLFTCMTNDGENVFISGYTNSTNVPVLNPGGGSFYQNNNLGFYEGTILQFDTSCTRKLATYFGDVSNEYLEGIACDGNKLLITGYTQSNFLPTLIPSGSYSQTISSGGIDVLISVFKNCNNPIINASANSPVCSGSSINFTANTISGASYQWFGPMSYFSSAQNPIITNCTTSQAGNYSVILSLPAGCSSATSVSVSVNASPSLSISYNNPVCKGDTIKLFSNSMSSYTWTGVSGFTSNIQNPMVVNSNSLNTGGYSLTALSSNGCSGSASLSVVVYSLPIVSITTNTNVCVGANINLSGNGGVAYNWQGPNNFNAGSANQTISNVTSLSQGYYVLTVTDVNNCKKSDSVFVSVSPCTEVFETIDNNNDMIIDFHPNPTFNTLYLRSENKNIGNYLLTVINSIGQKVIVEKNATQINVNNLSNGVYILLIENENKTFLSKKFVKIN
ncbi:MAG: T9SS type A sorting domain-containing protein [Bacteroidota bacterium]|nr:T9SS type A sorting domain-containing protein [Bacteroidota bacterium]